MHVGKLWRTYETLGNLEKIWKRQRSRKTLENTGNLKKAIEHQGKAQEAKENQRKTDES